VINYLFFSDVFAFLFEYLLFGCGFALFRIPLFHICAALSSNVAKRNCFRLFVSLMETSC
jgi:hypothetical protein